MAKYDFYKLQVKVGDEKANAVLEITVLFEDGDNIASVVSAARQQLKQEALAMKNSNFLKDIEP